MDRPRRTLHMARGSTGLASPNRQSSFVDSSVVIDLDGDPGTKQGDPKDDEYRENASHHTASTRPRSRKPKPEDLPRDELLQLLRETAQAKDNAEKTLKDIQGKRAADRKSWEGEKEKRKRLQILEKDLRHEIQELRHSFREQQDNFDVTTETLRKEYNEAEQDLIAKVAAQKLYPCLPDDKIENLFDDLWTRCREWVRRWVKQDFVERPPDRLHLLIDQCCCPQEPMLAARLSMEFQADPANATRVLAFAQLNRLVQGRFFATPFGILPEADRRSFETLHVESEPADPKETYAWRASTFRLLRACIGIEPLETRSDSVKSPWLKQVCEGYARGFVDCFGADALQKDPGIEPGKSLKELTGICIQAALLSLELWSQKSKLEVVDARSHFATPFETNSDLHAPYIGMGLDDDETTFNGAKAHMLVLPAISVRGDADGNNLVLQKVVSKSNVFWSRIISRNGVLPFIGLSAMETPPIVNKHERSSSGVVGESKRRKTGNPTSGNSGNDIGIGDPLNKKEKQIPPIANGIHALQVGSSRIAALAADATLPNTFERRQRDELAAKHEQSNHPGAQQTPAKELVVNVPQLGHEQGGNARKEKNRLSSHEPVEEEQPTQEETQQKEPEATRPEDEAKSCIKSAEEGTTKIKVGKEHEKPEEQASVTSEDALVLKQEDKTEPNKLDANQPQMQGIKQEGADEDEDDVIEVHPDAIQRNAKIKKETCGE